MDQQGFRKLVCGHQSGFVAVVLRFFLAIVSQLYRIAIWLRGFFYAKGILKTYQAEVPVISIGNITAGGTGKTPLVIWLGNFLAEKKLPCSILTRGYKIKAEKLSDEPAILAKGCPAARVVINPDRSAGAEKAVKEYGAKVLIMDDGFQHLRLSRDLDIITIDATCPFGYGRLLPAGLLREPIKAVRRAEAIVITRADQIAETELEELEEQLRSMNPEIIIARSVHEPVCAKAMGQKRIELDELDGKKVFAFCGIGNPKAFISTVKSLGVHMLASKNYDDHHPYTDRDIEDIYEEARYLGAEYILSTEKDWTKTVLPVSVKEADCDIIFAYVAIELRFTCGEEELKRLIEQRLEGKISPQ